MKLKTMAFAFMCYSCFNSYADNNTDIQHESKNEKEDQVLVEQPIINEEKDDSAQVDNTAIINSVNMGNCEIGWTIPNGLKIITSIAGVFCPILSRLFFPVAAADDSNSNKASENANNSTAPVVNANNSTTPTVKSDANNSMIYNFAGIANTVIPYALLWKNTSFPIYEKMKGRYNSEDKYDLLKRIMTSAVLGAIAPAILWYCNLPQYLYFFNTAVLVGKNIRSLKLDGYGFWANLILSLSIVKCTDYLSLFNKDTSVVKSIAYLVGSFIRDFASTSTAYLMNKANIQNFTATKEEDSKDSINMFSKLVFGYNTVRYTLNCAMMLGGFKKSAALLAIALSGYNAIFPLLGNIIKASYKCTLNFVNGFLQDLYNVTDFTVSTVTEKLNTASVTLQAVLERAPKYMTENFTYEKAKNKIGDFLEYECNKIFSRKSEDVIVF